MNIRGGVIGIATLASAAMAGLPAVADGGGPGWRPLPSTERPLLWQGLYAGGHIGYGWAGELDGVVGGGQIGYNWQVNQIVYGLEADASLSNISGGNSVSFGGMTASAGASIDWMATARGRIGFLMDPRLLAYATAGLGIVRSSWDARAGGFGLGLQASGSETSTGFVFGLGVEGKLNDTMSTRLEFLSLGGLDNAISHDGAGVVRASVNFKLGQ